MDALFVRKMILTLSLAAFANGCSQGKTAASVFPDNPAATSACSKQASENRFIVQWENGSFSVETDQNADQFRKSFVEKNLHLIKHVDRDVTIFSDVQTEATAAGELNWGPHLLEAPALWSQGIQGEGVIVGVVDGMVDVSHQQLHSNIFINTKEIPNNGIDDDNNGFIDDYMGVQINDEVNDPKVNEHGSHVSGIIAADSEFGPVEGVAPKAKILPAQFISNNQGGLIGDAIIAMNYAVDNGAKILNLSWGAGPCVEIPTLKAALKQVSDKGVLIITAAGNGDDYGIGINMDVNPTYPSAYNFLNQINVAATTIDDYMISFSNYGSRTVHVAAPGVTIYSTVPGNKVKAMSGTSMAAPMTSGAAALIWSAFPTATTAQVKQAIMKSVDVVPGRQIEVISRGRINVVKAYTELKKSTGH
jgi:subtilisin family serine protease